MCVDLNMLNVPDFNELIQSFDIVTFTETKLDEFDIIRVISYIYNQTNRKQNVIRRSGGIAVLINDKIYKHFKYIETECEYVLWFKIDKVFNIFKPSVVYATDRSKPVVPMLFLFCMALRFFYYGRFMF